MPEETLVEAAIRNWFPEAGRVVRCRRLGGGCISEAFRVETERPADAAAEKGCAPAEKDGAPAQKRGAPAEDRRSARILFVKRNVASLQRNFACEADGLRRLAEPQTIRVPRPLATGTVANHAWLVTDWVEPGPRPQDFFSRFGRQLAGLHRATRGQRIGLDDDNFLGSAPQPNAAAGTWIEFVALRRLGFQLKWARDQGLADETLSRDVEAIVDRLPQQLAGREETTSLLHGDLWSGNYLCDTGGQPVIIDPAAYYGCREAEFGMIRLFGGCPPEFEASYEATWPMPDGWRRRSDVYRLYHLLNHLNLFGGGYAAQCRSAAAEILRG